MQQEYSCWQSNNLPKVHLMVADYFTNHAKYKKYLNPMTKNNEVSTFSDMVGTYLYLSLNVVWILL